jgi:hypothetical protein
MTELWLLIRWMAEVVVTGDIENVWFADMPDDTWEFMYEVGLGIVQLFG